MPRKLFCDSKPGLAVCIQEKNQLISDCFEKEGMKVSENEVMSISNVISNERFDIKNDIFLFFFEK